MRRAKVLSCVLMMTLLLTACGAAGGEESAENLAARIRTEYLALAGWSASVDVHVDYGERVYDFVLAANWQREGESVLTVVEPELIAGITARLSKDGAFLEYDGVSLALGSLSGDGMSPLEAFPFLMEQLEKGYMAQCSYQEIGETKRLAVVCRDPDVPEGTGLECTLYFDLETHDLLEAEVSSGGFTVLTAKLSEFTKEMMNDDAGDDPDMG